MLIQIILGKNLLFLMIKVKKRKNKRGQVCLITLLDSEHGLAKIWVGLKVRLIETILWIWNKFTKKIQNLNLNKLKKI